MENNIKTMFDAAVDRAANAKLAEMLAELGIDAAVAETNAARKGKGTNAVLNALQSIADEQTDEPTQIRRSTRQGKRRSKVAYVVSTRKDRKEVSKALPIGNVRVVWNAMIAAKKPVTNIELEKLTGMTNKPVQSAVHFLRSVAQVIKSQPITE